MTKRWSATRSLDGQTKQQASKSARRQARGQLQEGPPANEAPTDSMIERMARAAYDRFHLRSNRPAWDAAPEKTKAAFRCDAKGLMAVMREPTEAMLNAMADAYHIACNAEIERQRKFNDELEARGYSRAYPEVAFPSDWLPVVHRAAIDAALAETKESR